MFPRVPATRVQVIPIARAFINPALRYLTGDALALRITTKSGSVEHRYAVRPLHPPLSLLTSTAQHWSCHVGSCMFIHTHTHTSVYTCEYKVLPLAPAHITLSPFLLLVCVVRCGARFVLLRHDFISSRLVPRVRVTSRVAPTPQFVAGNARVRVYARAYHSTLVCVCVCGGIVL